MIRNSHEKEGMFQVWGTEAPERETDLLAYTASDPKYAQNFSKMPEWMQKLCTEGQVRTDPPPLTSGTAPPIDPGAMGQLAPDGQPRPPVDEFDDEIPF